VWSEQTKGKNYGSREGRRERKALCAEVVLSQLKAATP
jgi:hypothetical protein